MRRSIFTYDHPFEVQLRATITFQYHFTITPASLDQFRLINFAATPVCTSRIVCLSSDLLIWARPNLERGKDSLCGTIFRGFTPRDRQDSGSLRTSFLPLRWTALPLILCFLKWAYSSYDILRRDKGRQILKTSFTFFDEPADFLTSFTRLLESKDHDICRRGFSRQ